MPDTDEETFNPHTSIAGIVGSKFKWAVFLLRSGRFAGAIFDKEKAICHKTFQRYTVRRKQGGSQSANDASGGKAKSAGATLRRYNEAALKQDIAELLTQWKTDLQDVEMIFLSSGKTDRSTFFDGKDPVLQPSDKRLKRIPFAVARPTFEEVCRVRSELSSAKFSPLADEKAKTPPPSSPVKSKKTSNSPIKSKSSNKEDAAIEQTDIKGGGAGVAAAAPKAPEMPALSLAVKEGDLVRAKALIDEGADVNVADFDCMTPLHHAASQDSVPLINLLLASGADPCRLDVHMRPPYFVCSTKETRNAFRRFRGDHEDRWDYALAQIPSALTDEMDQKRKDKEAEKRKRARERKKQQKKEAAQAKAQQDQVREEQERKIAAGLACDFCGKYAGKAPFTRLDFKYCSTDCVNGHRRQLMSEAALKRLGG